MFRDHAFNAVPKKFADFLLVSTTEKFNCKSKIWMKYGANVLEKQRVALVRDHKQRTLPAPASTTATYMAELFVTKANGF